MPILLKMPLKKCKGPSPINGLVQKPRKTKNVQRKVLKMLAVMEASAQNSGPSNANNNNNPITPDSSTNADEFLSSGRTGRRNALPDILNQVASVTSSDLPLKLQALTTEEKSNDQDASTSKSS